jgi:hypothetical protein
MITSRYKYHHISDWCYDNRIGFLFDDPEEPRGDIPIYKSHGVTVWGCSPSETTDNTIIVRVTGRNTAEQIECAFAEALLREPADRHPFIRRVHFIVKDEDTAATLNSRSGVRSSRRP